jgi:hypothetical protein
MGFQRPLGISTTLIETLVPPTLSPGGADDPAPPRSAGYIIVRPWRASRPPPSLFHSTEHRHFLDIIPAPEVRQDTACHTSGWPREILRGLLAAPRDLGGPLAGATSLGEGWRESGGEASLALFLGRHAPQNPAVPLCCALGLAGDDSENQTWSIAQGLAGHSLASSAVT